MGLHVPKHGETKYTRECVKLPNNCKNIIYCKKKKKQFEKEENREYDKSESQLGKSRHKRNVC